MAKDKVCGRRALGVDYTNINPSLRHAARDRKILGKQISGNRDGFGGAFGKTGARRQALGQRHIPNFAGYVPGAAADGFGR
jgi:hypothetical protein